MWLLKAFIPWKIRLGCWNKYTLIDWWSKVLKVTKVPILENCNLAHLLYTTFGIFCVSRGLRSKSLLKGPFFANRHRKVQFTKRGLWISVCVFNKPLVRLKLTSIVVVRWPLGRCLPGATVVKRPFRLNNAVFLPPVTAQIGGLMVGGLKAVHRGATTGGVAHKGKPIKYALSSLTARPLSWWKSE